MRDSREGKLPVWAKEIIEHERLKSALAWPEFQDPKPIATIDINGGGCEQLDVGSFVWSYNAYNHSVTEHEVKHNIRGLGPVYETEQDALDAKAWAVCRRCASMIYFEKEARIGD